MQIGLGEQGLMNGSFVNDRYPALGGAGAGLLQVVMGELVSLPTGEGPAGCKYNYSEFTDSAR